MDHLVKYNMLNDVISFVLIFVYNSLQYKVMEVRDFLALNYHPKIYFATSKQYRLGIAKLKKSLQIIPKNLLRNFKNFLFRQIFCWLTDWPIDRPTDRLTDAFRQAWLNNCYSYSFDFFTVPRRFIWRHAFSPTIALQCLHHGSTEAYLCSPLYSIPFSFTV